MGLLQAGRTKEAEIAFSRLLKDHPNQPDLLHALGVARAQLGDQAGAERSLGRAIRARPGVPALHVDHGQALIALERFDQAARAFERALAIDPNHVSALAALGELRLLIGEFEPAGDAIRQGLERNPNDLRLALALAKVAPRLGVEPRAIALLEDHLTRPAPSVQAAMAIRFRLGELYDRAGRADDAFGVFREANGMFQGRFDPIGHARAVDQMISNWNPAAIEALDHSGVEDELPVFIVGMPRSGTSLVEQILASHPEVHGAGELPEIQVLATEIGEDVAAHEPLVLDPATLGQGLLSRKARLHLAALRRRGGGGARRVTDKMPVNFLHLGLIDRLLPGARVINCVRDPLDTCVSCYFQWFRSGMPWAYRLDWLGGYYRQYERAMSHWGQVLGDLPILEVRYEEMVVDQERQTRRLLEFAGLEWNDACLEFHKSRRITATLSNEQVRRPMYRSSIGRNRKYAKHLGPLRRALGMGAASDSTAGSDAGSGSASDSGSAPGQG